MSSEVRSATQHLYSVGAPGDTAAALSLGRLDCREAPIWPMQVGSGIANETWSVRRRPPSRKSAVCEVSGKPSHKASQARAVPMTSSPSACDRADVQVVSANLQLGIPASFVKTQDASRSSFAPPSRNNGVGVNICQNKSPLGPPYHHPSR